MRVMQDSGIEWIGEIPKDWNVIRVKQVASGITDGTHGTFQRVSEGKPLLSAKNVFEDGLHITENESLISEEDFLSITKSGYPQKDDILLCCVGTVGRCMLYTLTEPNAFQRSVVFIRPNNLVLPGFLKYAIQCDSTVVQEYMLINQSAQAGLYQGSVKELKIPLPQKNEQKMIADFLDSNCSDIDALTSDIESQIDMLEQYKRSVITEAVTKGLNPDAEMKDSGVEWIGLMPSHWDCIRGKYVLSYLQKPVREDDEVITCFRDGEVTLRSNRREDGFTMSDKEIGYQGIDIGDLVVHGMDGFAGAIGISDSRGKGSPVLNVLGTNQNKRYIMYYLRSMAYSDVFVSMATGIRVRSCDLRWNKLSELMYPIPPIEEQQSIVDYIDDTIQKTDAVIADKQAQLDTLAEYKKSLIYEYVTGKKEVPTS